MHLPPWALWLASDCPHPVCAKGESIWRTHWSEKQPRRLENSTPRTCVSLTLNLGWCPWFATFNNSTELHYFPLNKVQRMMIRYERDQRIGRTTVMKPSTLWICDTWGSWRRWAILIDTCNQGEEWKFEGKKHFYFLIECFQTHSPSVHYPWQVLNISLTSVRTRFRANRAFPREARLPQFLVPLRFRTLFLFETLALSTWIRTHPNKTSRDLSLLD